VNAALQLAEGWWAERLGAERMVVFIGQVLGGNLCSSTFLVGEMNAGLFGDEGRFGRRRSARLGFTSSLGLPLEHRFPVLDLFAMKIFFPFCSRQRKFCTIVVVLVAPRAAVRLNVVEQLALDIVGDLSAVNHGGRVGAFEARREFGGLLVGGAGRVLAGLELIFFFLSGRGWVAFGFFIVGIQYAGDGGFGASELGRVGAGVHSSPNPSFADRSAPIAGMSNTVVSAGDIWPSVNSRYRVSGRVMGVGSWESSRSARRIRT
jgi:hypothetical protein